jgi:hypothetical protein
MTSYLKRLVACPGFDGGLFHFGEDVVESYFRDKPPTAALNVMAKTVTEAFNHFVTQGRFPDQVAFRFGDHSLLVLAEPLRDEPGSASNRRPGEDLFLDHLFLTLCVRHGEPITLLLRKGREVLVEAAKEALAA